MATFLIMLKTLVPTTYSVEVEAESEQEAYRKVKDDIDANGWGSQYWADSDVQEHWYDSADDLEVLPPEEDV